MADESGLIDFLQRAVGYALTGDTSERTMFIAHGVGRNGKTTLLETISEMLGDYALRTPTETLMVKREGSIPNDVARLKGARFVYASEAEEGKRLAESFIKDITGGDRLSARFMRSEFFDFRPECKIWLGTNHRPVIRGTDHAIWDRIRLIPFAVRIPDDEVIPRREMMRRFQAEMPGILAWAVRGCAAWQRDGLGQPEAIARATDAYRAEMDVIGEFLADRCVLDLNASVRVGDLYAAYALWCESAGERAMTQRMLGMRLIERGHEQTRSGHGGKWHWAGIRVKTSDEG